MGPTCRQSDGAISQNNAIERSNENPACFISVVLVVCPHSSCGQSVPEGEFCCKCGKSLAGAEPVSDMLSTAKWNVTLADKTPHEILGIVVRDFPAVRNDLRLARTLLYRYLIDFTRERSLFLLAFASGVVAEIGREPMNRHVFARLVGQMASIGGTTVGFAKYAVISWALALGVDCSAVVEPGFMDSWGRGVDLRGGEDGSGSDHGVSFEKQMSLAVSNETSSGTMLSIAQVAAVESRNLVNSVRRQASEFQQGVHYLKEALEKSRENEQKLRLSLNTELQNGRKTRQELQVALTQGEYLQDELGVVREQLDSVRAELASVSQQRTQAQEEPVPGGLDGSSHEEQDDCASCVPVEEGQKSGESACIVNGLADVAPVAEEPLAIIAPESGPAVTRVSRFSQATEVGAFVKFGRYPQKLAGGWLSRLVSKPEYSTADSLEWLVVEKSDKTALLVARYGIDSRPFHERSEPVCWESCSMRRWLNNEFFLRAFTEEERAQIAATRVNNAILLTTGEVGTGGGRDTYDRVFLLSTLQADLLFASDAQRSISATAYAVSCGAKLSSSRSGWWWLRTPGLEDCSATYVSSSGQIEEAKSRDVAEGSGMVLPAIRVKL